MKSKIRLLAITAVIISSCTTLRTSSETNKAANFTKYKTFKLVHFYNQAELEQKNIYITQDDVDAVTKAINSQLKNRGMSWSENNDAVLIWSFGLDLKTKYSWQTNAGGGTYGWGYYGAYGPSISHGYSSVSTQQEVKGKLSIGLIDAKTNELLWLGEGKRKMRMREARSEGKIAENIARIMSTFPIGGE